jgi:monoamine oxidase
LAVESDTRVIIIGAGLTGLLLAYRLKNAGISFRVLEARNRVGGRIHTVLGAGATPVEMGATWFHYQHRHLFHLLNELKVPYYPQFMEGKAFFQATDRSPIESFLMPEQHPSYRISGGTAHLIEKLMIRMDDNDLVLGSPVTSILYSGGKMIVKALSTYTCETVVLTVPPRLWKESISFDPGLSDTLLETAGKTQTWMEDSVKAAVTYDHPFWRENKMSGTLFSNAGPVTEFYDHCDEKAEKFALCGFLHPSCKTLEPSERKQMIVSQLGNTFGEKAALFEDYLELDWSEENYTSASIRIPLLPHQNNGNMAYQHSRFDGRLFFGGTETSPHHGGYMEGAVYSASQILAKLLRTRKNYQHE